MKKILTLLLAIVAGAVFLPVRIDAQALQMSDFSVFGGDGSCPNGAGQAAPTSPGCAVVMASSVNVTGGKIGSYNLVQTTGNATIAGSIHSGRKVTLANSNTVGGSITAANSSSATGTILSIGSSANIVGNIAVNGNTTVGGGTVSGSVTHPAGTTYTGPVPGGGNITATPTFPTLPAMPPITTFPAYGTTNITNTITITPGAYKDVTISASNKVITFNGTGVYTFKSIKITGSNTTFKYNFQNSTTGTIKIYVHGDVDVYKSTVAYQNGGSPSKIYMEIHGNGSSCSPTPSAFTIANGSGNWDGTVWAPYARINVGSGSGSAPKINGALYSGTQVNLCSNVQVDFYPFSTCTTPTANAGNDASFCAGSSAQIGSASIAGNSYSWSPTTGLSSSTVSNPTVTSSTSGSTTYTVTVTSGTCTNTDQVVVTVNPLPVVSAGTYAAVCVNGSSVTLAGTPAGGTFSGSGVTGNSFNPATAGVGTKTITYSYTNANGCTNTATTSIVVNNITAANAGTYTAVCVNGTSVTLAGSPAGGTFSGSGVTGNSFNPATAGVGTKTITYTYTNASGCISSATTTIVVNNITAISAGTYAAVCTDGSQITLSGSPAGGTFSGNGVTGNSFNPATAGPGTQTITYSFTNGNNCSNTATTNIVVNALPVVDAGVSGQLDCSTPTTVLHGTATPGSVLSWIGSAGGHVSANGNTTTPTIDAHGTFTLTATDPATGCSASDITTVIFDPCIFPGYNPPPNGKSGDIIGSELTSLSDYYQTNGCNNPDLDIYIINDQCQVLVEIIYQDGMLQQLYDILVQSPYNITDTVDNGNGNRILTTFIDIQDLDALNNLNITTGINLINHVRPVFRPIPTAGAAYSLGDIAQQSDIARNGFNVGGEGIKVGVISNSYNTVDGGIRAPLDVVNGDLPGPGNPDGYTTPVQVLQDYPYGAQSDEGRAMLQIVHDVAPKSTLAFATGFISAGNMAQKIRSLQQVGCQVEVDDITYITEPFFRDGMIAQAVNDVTALGVSYFTSAGNYGDKSYEGIYTPVAAPGTIVGTAHDFGGGDRFQNISLTPGSYLVVMQWEDEFYSIDQQPVGTANDLDIYLTYDNGITLFGFNRNNIGGDPIEVLPFTVTQNTNTNILITRETGNGSNVHFKYIVFKVPAGGFVPTEFNQGNSTIVGQANSLGAITTGAVLYSNTPAFGVTPTKASFSSVGGTLTYGSPRNKPDLCAPNGGNTTVQLGGPNVDLPDFPLGDAFPNFYGTSAAAPHAAGIGALLLSAKQKYYNIALTPAQVKNLLTSTATDMYTPGFDYLSGYGLANADNAMRTFAAPTPQLISLDVPNGVTPGNAPFTLTVTADYITTQSTIVFRDVTLPTTWIDAHHLSAPIPSFFGNPPIEVCTPGIAAPDFLDGGCSNVLYFFSPVKRNVVVSADNKTKKFGEVLPAFTATVTVDGLSLQAANLTLADLGLENIQYTLPAGTNNLSDVGIYFINPSAGPFDVGLTELYNYTFNTTSNNQPGLLSIQKMPLVITPQDKTVLFGDKIDGTEIEYTYIYDATNIAPGDQTTFLNNLKNIYEPNIAKQVALIDDRDEYNNATLSQTDIVNLAFISGSKGIANGSRGIANGSRGIANGTTPDTTYVVDLPYQTLVQYNSNGADATLSNDILLMNGSHGIANGSRGIANSVDVANGTALINGSHPIANGSRGIANGSHGIVNSEELDGVSNTNTAVILHESDLDTQENPDSTFQMISINAITGLTAGQHFILPGGFMSYNFEVSYGAGHLNVNPYEITIDANDATTQYGTAPAYSSVVTGYQYDDVASTVFTGGISYSPASNSQINVGSHTIVPSATLAQPSNYYLTILNGNISVSPATLNITANNQNPACSSLPVFTSSITGYKFNDNAGNVIAAMPGYTVLNSQQQVVNGIPPAGTYQIVPSGAQLITPSNYVIQYANGTLVEPALLTLAAAATNPQCSNQTGSVALVPTGGTSPYGFSGSTTNLGSGTYNYTVTDAHGCTATASATIVVPTAITSSTSSTASGCSSPTGSATVVAGGGTPPYSYLWTPGNQTGATATSLAIGTYTVRITDAHGCTKSASVSVAANQSVPATPVFNDFDNSGNDNHAVGDCGGGNYEFELNPITGVTSFTWTAPTGSTITDGCGHSGNPLTVTLTPYGCGPVATHPEVHITFPSSFVSGTVTVYATNACGNSPTASFAVQSKPNAPGAISGPTTGLCNSSGKVYSIAAVPGATSYTWTKPSGTTISGSSNGTSITVNYGSSFSGTGTYTVKANNACGSSATSSLTVDAKPAQPGSITGNTSVCKTNTAVAYSIAAVTGASSYTWTISGGATFVGSATGASVTVKYTTATSSSATLTVKANNSCGSSAVRSQAITVNLSCRETGDYQAAGGNEFNVFPNPTSNKATVSFEATEGSRATLDVYDLNGSLVSRILDGTMSQAGIQSVEVDCTSMVKGIYFIRLTIGEETSIAKLVVIK